MNGTVSKKILLVLFVFVLVLPVHAYARNFLRTLTVGDYGEDVRFVQQILNLSTSTQVAMTGLGSPGNETSYFGPATKVAIIKFQNLYANEVLKPAGLLTGTGFAGWFTLKKINQLADMYNQSHTPPQSTSVSTGSTTSVVTPVGKTPFIISVSPTTFGNDDLVTIHGQNFDMLDNTVLLSTEDDNKFTNISSFDSKTISIRADITLADGMSKGKINNLTGSTRAEVIADLLKHSVLTAGPGDGSAYLPATIMIKNKNGQSNSISVLVRVINK